MARGVLVVVAALALGVGVALALEAGLWMGTGLRTLVAWTLAALAVGLLGALVGVPLLRGLGVLGGLDERAVARRTSDDFAGVGDRLTAALDLADGHGSSGPDALRSAALDALTRDLDGVPFERVRVWGPARQALAWAAGPLAVLALAFLLAPDATGSAARRLLAPGTYFAPPAPFTLALTPGDTSVTRGTDLPIRVVAAGRELPATATLEIGRVGERATERVRLQRDGSASSVAFVHTVEGVAADLRYRVEADGVRSAWFTARVEDRPLVRGLQVTVVPPGFSGRAARSLPEGVGDVTGLPGTVVRVRVGLGGTPAKSGWLRIDWDGGPSVRVPLRLDGTTGAAAFVLRGAGRYAVHLRSAAGLENLDPAEYALGTLADAPPQIVMTEGAETVLSPAARRLGFRITDDFGFAGASVVWRIAQREGGGTTGFRRTALPIRSRPLDQDASVVWRLPGARPGDVVELYGEVRDNGRPRHVARTPLVTLRFPSLVDRLDELAAERDSARQTLDTFQQTAERSGERFQRLRDQLRREPTPDWENRRQVQELQGQQHSMQQQAQQLQEQMQQMADQLQGTDLVDEQTMRMMEQMQQVMQELDSPELREALQRLQEAMEQLDLREMLDSADQAERLQEQLQQRLQRAMDLMERLEAAVAMQETARRAEDLAERQEQLARDTERLRTGEEPQDAGEASDGEQGEQDQERDAGESGESGERGETPAAEQQRIEEAQRRAAEDAQALQEQIEALREQLEQMRNSPTAPADAAQQQMQQDGGLPQQMQEAADQVREGQLQEAQEQQQDAARRFRRMAQQMMQSAQGMQSQRQKVDAAALRRALEDVLTLSQRQEALASETGRTPVGNPALVPLGRRQRDLNDGFRAVVDTLVRVGRSVPQLGAAVQLRATNARSEMDRALAAMGERQAPVAAASQRMAMSHLNELALLLAEVLDNLQNESQSQSGGGGGMSQQMQQMGEAQQQLNGQIQQMLNEIGGQRLSGDQGSRLRQMAEQQEALRRRLEGMIRGADGTGLDPAQRSALQRLADQMRDAAAELRSGRLDTRAAPRQQQILERMLEAQRSVNQRGREERREGEAARRVEPPPSARRPATTRPADRIRADLIRALESGYSADYQDLIKRYFERLQGRYAD